MISKIKKIILLLALTTNFSFAQDNFYKYLEMGEYKVGFTDTLIFNNDVNYYGFDYSGGAPLFIQIWYPLRNVENTEYLNFKQLRMRRLPKIMEDPYAHLMNQIRGSFIDFNIKYCLNKCDTINYGMYTYENVLDTLMLTKTMSISHNLKEKLNFPLILYHHGAQSFSDDNYLLAEYFASKGFIVVSSNFHLPYEDHPYGSYLKEEDLKSNPKKVIEFAKSITSNKELIFIGHSMGAQTGFSFLYEKGYANAFVSLETTIEDFSKREMKEEWPEIEKNRLRFELPILMFATIDENKPYEFTYFNRLLNSKIIQVVSKKKMNHDGYLSTFYQRYLFRNKFSQPDIDELELQFKAYILHLKMIEYFIKNYNELDETSMKQFEDNFYIKISTNK